MLRTQRHLLLPERTAGGEGSPWHVRSSLSSRWPLRQPHSKLPTALRQEWSQPPLLARHSSMSVGRVRARRAGCARG